MRVMNQDVDYKNNIFESAELTRVHGEPNTSTLLNLRNEIRSNAQSVHTTLGGGKYGHLGLVMNDITYLTLPEAQEYARPAFPGPFRLEDYEISDAEIAELKADWEEDMRLWREVDSVERALVQQIVADIESKYLKALRNPLTTKITQDIKTILNHLFNNYGKVPPAVLKNMKRKVEDFDMDPNDPIDLLFVEIDDLKDIYILQKNELTEKQLVDLAYVIVERAKVFKKDLRDWNKMDEDSQKWSDFKIHFRKAQQELRDSGDLTVERALDKTEVINAVSATINTLL